MGKAPKTIPRSVIRRLTRYLTEMQSLEAGGIEWVSSADIADTLGLTSSTVRQDLSHLDFSGISKRGYSVSGLAEVLGKVLGVNAEWRMVVVGAGHLGSAIAMHDDFSRRGFNICGIFDSDHSKVGKKVGHLTIQHAREIPRVIKRHKVDIGIVAVPANAAQGVADMLIVSGIRGILNLALHHIIAPARVAVVDTRMTTSIMELAHAIKTRS